MDDTYCREGFVSLHQNSLNDEKQYEQTRQISSDSL